METIKEKSAFFKGWLKFWTYIGGLLQDQGDRASSKRATLFAVLFVFCYHNIVLIRTPEAQMNMQLYWGNFAALLTFGGYVVSEVFSGIKYINQKL